MKTVSKTYRPIVLPDNRLHCIGPTIKIWMIKPNMHSRPNRTQWKLENIDQPNPTHGSTQPKDNSALERRLSRKLRLSLP